MHGRGAISILHIDISVESTKMDNDLLVGLCTGQMKSRPGMVKWRNSYLGLECIQRRVQIQEGLTCDFCQRHLGRSS